MLPSFLLKKMFNTQNPIFFHRKHRRLLERETNNLSYRPNSTSRMHFLKIFHRGAINFFAALSSLSLPSKIGIVWTSRKEFEFSNFNAIWPCIFHSNRKFFNRNCTYENYSMEMRSNRKYTIMRWINCWNFHKNIQLHPLIIRRKWIK